MNRIHSTAIFCNRQKRRKKKPYKIIFSLFIILGMQCVMVPDPDMYTTPEYMTEAHVVIPSLLDFKPEWFGLPAFDN